MVTLKETVNQAKNAAMKAKLSAKTEAEVAQAELRLAVARSVLGAIEKAEMAGKTRTELSEDAILAVIKSEAKTRRGSVEIYTNAGALDRAEREAAEAEIVEAFLPQAATEAELEEFIKDYVAANSLAERGRAATGEVMKALRGKFSNFDGKTAARLTAKVLS